MNPLTQSLLAAVLENPTDDTPRLIYADFLEEQGDAARSEFIRVQIEVDKPDGFSPFHPNLSRERYEQWLTEFRAEKKPAYDTLRRRERELLLNWALWLDVRTELMLVLTNEIIAEATIPKGGLRIRFRRGFVERIELSTRDFLAHAKALFASQPITQVVLSDKRPASSTTSGARQYWWFRNGNGTACIPDSIVDMMGYTRIGAVFETVDAALQTISDCCVAYGRSQAGIHVLAQPG